jgi:hypothetical protein
MARARTGGLPNFVEALFADDARNRLVKVEDGMIGFVNVKTDYRARATSRAFFEPRDLSGRSSWLARERLLVLLRGDLPVVGARLGGHRPGGSSWGEFRDDFVDMAATVADHKQDLYDTVRGAGGDARHIQVEHQAPCAVGIHSVGALFLPWW